MQVENSPAANAEAEAVMAALSDLAFESTEVAQEEIIGDETVVAVGDEAIIEELKIEAHDEEFLDDLDLHIKRQEAYESQTATEMPDIEATRLANEADAPIKVVKVRGASKTPRAASTTPRVKSDLASIDARVFQLSDLVTYDATGLEENKATVIASRPTQVKIAEKFDNLFMALNANRKPSTYVMQAYQALAAKGEMTSVEIVAAFKAAGLGDGTAQSQAGQIMVLFAVTGIAKRDGQKLTLLAESTVAKRLTDLLAPPAVTVAEAPAPTPAK